MLNELNNSDDLAETIRKLSRNTETLLCSGLKFDAIVVLLADSTGLGKNRVTKVLESLVELEQKYVRPKAKPDGTLDYSVLNTPIKTLSRLSSRVKKLCQFKLKIATVGELIGYSASDLQQHASIGDTTVENVRDVLAELGLKLAGE